MDLFFVLSGFLVSGLLFSEFNKKGKVNIGRFLIRRGFKIYPTFYFFIFISILLGKLISLSEYDINAEYFAGINRNNVIAELFFVQNYLGGIWINTWSLGVEEHFYFGIAILILLAYKFKFLDKPNVIVPILLVMMITPLCLRFLNYNNHPDFYYLTHLFPTHLRADSLLSGVFASYLFHFKKDWFSEFLIKYKFHLTLISVVFLSTTFIFHIKTFFMNTIGLTMVYSGFAILLSLMVVNPKTHLSISKMISQNIFNAISKIGIFSYSIYIWHLLVKHYSLYLFQTYLPDLPNILYFLIYFILAIVFGILSSKIIEIPFLKLRNRLTSIDNK